MDIAAYLQHLAQRCYQLATRCFDLGVAGSLNAMGDELTQKSRELELPTPPSPPAAGQLSNLKRE